MSTQDDLAALFLPPPAGAGTPMTYRQGVVVAWNPETAENTIRVGGTDLTDIPILGLGQGTTLRVGDVVGLMLVGSSWAIMGQLVIPGTTQAARAISVPSANTYSASTAAFETRDTSTWGDLATVGPIVDDVQIGPSGRCLVYITSTIVMLVTAGGGEMAYEISGATTVGTGDTPPALSYYGPAGSGPTSTRLVLQEGLTPGIHTFTAKYSAPDFSAGGSARFGGRNLTVVAL